MANLSDEHKKMLKSLGYEPVDDDSGRILYRNDEADSEVNIVEIVGHFHFDFSGASLTGERTNLQDLILSEDLLKRLTEESKAGKEISESSPPAPG